ncbi:HIT family protein [Streptosporangium vulgare]|uniref:HIT family protein n=1 Tax=Streptosporangium vulgare TaxID=46190 RepID=A0ABV5TSK3_9ACTN
MNPSFRTPKLDDFDGETAAQVWRARQRVARALRRGAGVRCERMNLFLADGEVAFQEVFHLHLHLHVIPRYSGDGSEIRARWKPGREIYSLRTPQPRGKCCDKRPAWKSR